MDFLIKRYIDKKYARKVEHPRLKKKIILEKYYNDGATLNFLADRPKWMKMIHTIVMAGVCIVYYFVLRLTGKPLSKTGMALLAGGGFSNLLDRYTKGHVVDYFRINVGPKRLRNIVFNISDFFIFIGALLAVIGSETD